MDRFTIALLVMICILCLMLFSIENLYHRQPADYYSQTVMTTAPVMERSGTKTTDQKPLNTVAQKSFRISDPVDSVFEQTNPNAEEIQINPETLRNLTAGQEIEFLIPQQSRTYTGTIEQVSKAASGANTIATGQLIQYHDAEGPATFSIIRDDQLTFVTIRTGSDSFQIKVNNDSGKGSVNDLHEQQQIESENPDSENEAISPDRTSPSPLGSRESFFDS